MSSDPSAAPSGADETGEQGIRALLARLGRPHANGGTVIERAALLAEGGDFDATIAWIVAHGGEPEARAAAPARHGLYGSRLDSFGAAASQTPLRFVLPPGALQR